MRRVHRTPSTLLASLIWLATTAACGEPSEGTVMVVVSTDMLVPADIDTLDWQVTIAGHARPYQEGSVDLEQIDLPGTLAVHSGPKTTSPVVIELVGLLGGEDRGPRVERSAELKVPRHGIKELWMPLGWLCSEANLAPEGCLAGKTCRAGECVDRVIADPSALPDYVERSESSCFNTSECFPPKLC